MNARTLTALVMTCAAAAAVSCSRSRIPSDPRAEAFAALPDWRGIWIAEGLQMGISGQPEFNKPEDFKVFQLVGMDAPWNEVGQDRFRAAVAAFGRAKAEGWGYPGMMDAPAPLQFVITPDEVLILNIYHEVRQVYTDRPHSAEQDRWPTTWGDSVGHWEGDTLVIDTVSVRNPNRFMWSIAPLSDQAHYVERLRKSAPDRIEMEMTIEDPSTLRKPWVVKTAYVRAPNSDRLLVDAYENDRSVLAGDAFTIAPPKQ